MSRDFAYIRVSSKDQNVARQKNTFIEMGIDEDLIFMDKESGKDFNRSDYLLLKRVIKDGDSLTVTELDRLGRNKIEIKNELEWLKKRGVRVRILDLPSTLVEIDGQTWIIEMINNILIEVLATFAEEERNKIRKRQAEGIAAAKAEGKYLGRPHIEYDKELFNKTYVELKQKKITAVKAMKILGLKSNTFYRRLREYEKKNGS